MNSLPNMIDIWGCQIWATNLAKAKEKIEKYDFDTPNYICLPDIYVLIQCYKSKSVRDVINGAHIVLPDGKPIEFYARLQGHKNFKTVSGFWLCKELLGSGFSHFFYGTDDATLSLLKTNIDKEFPNARIFGYKAPPMMQVGNIEENDIISRDIRSINELGPDIIWVGISSPKQDFLMRHMVRTLDRGLVIGIGGVFDYLAGTVKISPEWVKKIGFRWLYRFFQNPRWFWKKNCEIFFNLPIIMFKELGHLSVTKKG